VGFLLHFSFLLAIYMSLFVLVGFSSHRPALLSFLSSPILAFLPPIQRIFSFAFHWILEVRLLIRLLLLCPIFVSLLPLLFSSSVLIISMTPSLFLIFFFLLWH
jgi:hypothetical protein